MLSDFLWVGGAGRRTRVAVLPNVIRRAAPAATDKAPRGLHSSPHTEHPAMKNYSQIPNHAVRARSREGVGGHLEHECEPEDMQALQGDQREVHGGESRRHDRDLHRLPVSETPPIQNKMFISHDHAIARAIKHNKNIMPGSGYYYLEKHTRV